MIHIDIDGFVYLLEMMNQHHPNQITYEIFGILTNTQSNNIKIKPSLDAISFYAQSVSNLYQLIQKHLNDSIVIYQELEKNIQKEAGISIENVNRNIKIDYFHTNIDTHTSITENKSLYSYWKNGICAGGSIALVAIDTNAKYQSQYVNVKASADLLKAKASIDGRVKFTQNGKTFMPAIIVRANGSVAFLQADGLISLGSSKLHADLSGNLDVGIAQAKGEAVFKKDEITLKGDIGAAAIQVSGKGSISVLGVTISVSASTSFGSVGAGAEFSLKEGEVSFGANAALLAGVGVKFDIDY